MNHDSSQNPLIVELYEAYLVDQVSADFVKGVSQRYTIATLERLARQGRRTARRGAVLGLSFLGDYESNATLGHALIDRDRSVRTLAENGIQSVWFRVGSENQRQVLRTISRLNRSKQYDEAMQEATDLIHQSPWLAEAWNQRGLAYSHKGDFASSIRDRHQALEINPYHFVAAAGMGSCYLRQENRIAALESFRRALRLNPSMEDVRVHVVRLQRSLKEE